MLFATSNTVPGGSTNRAIAVSFDDGATFTPLDTGVAGVGIAAAAHSIDRDETLFLDPGGRIFRTVDGVVLTELTNDIGSHAWVDMIRVDELGLYIACTTDLVKTSADGVTWIAATIPAGSWLRLGWNPYTAVVTVGKSNNTTTSVASSTDAATFALITSMGFATSVYELTQAANGVYMFGTRDNNYTISSPDLSAFTQRAGITSQQALTYDPITDLFAASGATLGVFTADPATLVWVQRSSGSAALYGGTEDLTPQTGGGFVGVRPPSGGVVRNNLVRSDATGLTWSFTTPFPFDDAPLTRILNVAAPIFTVPDVIGLSLSAATAAIIAAGFSLGTVATQETNSFPADSVFTQFPPGGTVADEGTAVALTVAVPNTLVIPDVIGLTLADAENAIRAAGFQVGAVTVTTEPLGVLGTVVIQSPPGGSSALPGAKVELTSTALIAPFDVDQTVISQYAASPTIVRLVEDMAAYVDQRVNMTNFFNLVWNVDTATGFGLDIWGRIVGVTRLLQLPSDDPIFGYTNADDPPDWQTFNNGIFFPGTQSTQAFLLLDDAFRTLILTKALSNIVATNAASLNQLLRNLFPGRGKAYVQDLGGMAMVFVFEFALTTTEYAILTQSGALPHPAGVSYSVVVIPTAALFGFSEAGALPFDFGVFYLPAA